MLHWGDFAVHSQALQEALAEANEALAQAQAEYEILQAKIVALRMEELGEMFPHLREE